MNNKWIIGYWCLLIGMLIGITFSLVLYDKTHHINKCQTIYEIK